ncbi:MAG: L,D-transpeptidase family protein, partial [Solirubrobacteraceae bacterium]
YMLRQEPGPDNALGRVKFMFPNDYSVYLHDTPSKSLFEKNDRAFSSGCIRVENPFELATLLLDHNPGWDRAAIDRAIADGKTKSITLAQPVPVLLAYWTAWVDRSGVLQIRRDVYGRDAKVAAALARDSSFRPLPP